MFDSLIFCGFLIPILLAQCPPNTFRCLNDSSCIPNDWVNDGEPDCNDSSDERNASLVRPNDPLKKPIPAFVSHPTTINSSKGLSTEDSLDDPFDQIVTISSPRAVTLKGAFSTSGGQASISRQQGICSNIVQFKINDCSEDLTTWLQSIGYIELVNGSLLTEERRWRVLDHGCELLVEYRRCTKGLDKSFCELPDSIRLWNDIELYVCQLLLPSIKEYMGCFSRAEHGKCLIKKKEERGSPFCQIISAISTDLSCVRENSEENCDANALEVIGPLESETTHIYAQLECDRVIVKQGYENVLKSLTNIEKICTEQPLQQWSAVHRTLCANYHKIMMYQDCYQNATQLITCNQKPANDTVCSILDQFSSNIDCILPTLNDICTVESQNVVVAIQDGLNDYIIANKCYAQADLRTVNDDEDFQLKPLNKPCTGDQENLALACLVELIEVNKKLADLQYLNIFQELSDTQSTLITSICGLYQRYENCINSTVFVHSNGERCSFNSPLNTLTRIGLSPLCNQRTRFLLQKNNDCMQKLKNQTVQCHTGLSNLGTAIHYMLQGIHGEAHLCNSFYLIREAFMCGEKLVSEMCLPEAAEDLKEIKMQVEGLGIEEGCPAEQPPNLNEILSRPVVPPKARILPPIHQHAQVDQNQSSDQSRSMSTSCDVQEQKKFAVCIQPITTYQPHPLAVIKQPKEIDNACKQFTEFRKCQENVQCLPLWAKGMSAMFEYACGSGYSTYLKVRQCVRKTTTREDVRECVSEFSRGAPQLACSSSNTLLQCALPIIKEKCGDASVQFVKDYVEKFAVAIDSGCKITGKQSVQTVTGHNCTAEESALIKQCSAPLNDLSSRIDELFEGGLQKFLGNVKNLAPVFAEGCNLANDFKQCIHLLLQQKQCIVSSCLLRAGNDICGQPDTAKAIDDHLACLFKQASDPDFGRCLRTTIATLKSFNLAALRSVLPKFVTCVEHIVTERCGRAPLNVLRAISTTDICPVTMESGTESEPEAAKICSDNMKQEYEKCVGSFYRNFRMLPIALINDPTNVDKLCEARSQLSICSYSSCEEKRHRAVKALADFICIRRDTYSKFAMCLASVATSTQGTQCLANYLTSLPERQCMTLTSSALCSAQHINEICGYDALTLAFEGMNTYARELNDSCSFQIPVALIKTSCSESDVVDYLQCENIIDSFGFIPISFLRDSSQLSNFCTAVNAYERCLDNTSCKFEPATTTNLAFFKQICGVDRISTQQHLHCLTQYINSEKGKQCIKPFVTVDFLAKDISETICTSMEKIFSCAAEDLLKQCGVDALKHVSNTHAEWIHSYNKTCNLLLPHGIKDMFGKIEEELSVDAEPTIIENDGTIPPNQTSNVSIAPKLQSETIDESQLEAAFRMNPVVSDHTESLNLTTLLHSMPYDTSTPTSKSEMKPTQRRIPEGSQESDLEKPKPEPSPEPALEHGLNIANLQPEPEPKPGLMPPTDVDIPTAEPEVTPNITKQRAKGSDRSCGSHHVLYVLLLLRYLHG